ncbi:MAG: aldo/keto reductase [Elusimicrobiota bacterium]|jgi:predicted oxidoreductase|nr:aldo/keto reductase [Elusimicrobiota bacterium]
MKKIKLGTSTLEVPSIAVGCMRIHTLSPKELGDFISFCVDNGFNFFDHANVYQLGKCEELFGQAFAETKIKRESVIFQTKCGIVKGDGKTVAFDFSKDEIINSVDASLKRLKTDYIDALLLHRPDILVEPEQVAEAFDKLHSSGKVRWFGVSNQKPMQIELLRKFVKQPIVINQLQLSITNCTMLSQDLHVNQSYTDRAIDRDGGIVEYCRIKDITIQTWSPFQIAQTGLFQGSFIDNEKFPALNEKLGEIAKKYSVSKNAIAVAWILRHPANMQVVTGTTKTERLKDCFQATDIRLTHKEWYEIYIAGGNLLP